MEEEYKFLAAHRVDMEGVAPFCREQGWEVAPLGRVMLLDLYYDTPDRALLAAGGSTRRRTVAGQTVVTVKGPPQAGEGGLFRREEWEKPLAEVGPSFFTDRGLIPTLHVTNTRRTFSARQGEVELELALDSVSYRLGNRRGKDYQVELELKSPAGLDALRALGEAVAALPGLTPAAGSKYQRGMEKTAC